MINKVIRRAELVKGGTTIKQGEIFTLGFQFFEGAKVVIPTPTQVVSVKIANKSGVIYETVGVVVVDHVEFTVSQNIGYGEMHVEIKVTEGTTLIQKYPADGFIKLKITESLDDLGVGGIGAITAEQMFALIADTQAQFDSIVIESGTSDAETIQARGGEVTLNARLNTLDQQLVAKANESEVRKRSVKIELEDASAAFVSAITGGATVNVLSIPQNQSVSHEKTVFLKTGKNLFDKTKRTIGYVVESVDGVLYPDLGTGYDTSDFTPVYAGITYFINKVRKYALYNTSKTFVSGVNNTSYGSATFTPTVDGYVRFYTGTAFVNTTQLEVGSVGTVYEDFKLEADKLKINNSNLTPSSVSKDNLQLGIVEEKHISSSSNIVLKKTGKNLLDISKATSGFYVDYSNGNLVANVDNKVTDYVPLLPNTAYTLSNQSPQVATKDLSQLAFYNSSKGYVSGLANSGTQQSVTFTTGATVYYMRSSIPATVTDGIMLELGTVMSPYEPYAISIQKADLPSELFTLSNVKTVKLDGTGDFTNLRTAISSITDASKSKPYTVEIYEGTYDIFGYYTSAELNTASFDGLRVPDYVSIVGIGDKKKIILKGELPTEDTVITYASKGRISTVCPLGTGSIENMTVTGMNLRYAVHDDYNYPDATLKVKNCVFIHYKGDGRNYGGKQAWGEGSWSGQTRIFEDCTFISEWDYYGYTSHNNTNFTSPSKHKFINCKFLTLLGDASLRFESLGSGQIDRVEMIGCKMNASVDLTVHASNTAGVINHDLKGYGNDVVPVRFFNTDGTQHTYEFIGETQEMFNSSVGTILKGQPVMQNVNGTAVIPFVGTGKIRFYGIAMKDILAGASGIIKTGGYLAISDTGLTGLVVGDTVGIVGGVLAKVTTSDYIGVVTLTNHIKLN